MKKNKNIKINAVFNIIRQVSAILYSLIMFPYVSRVLQAENLGKVNFVNSTVSYFTLVAVLGLTVYAARDGVQYRDVKDKLSVFSSELLSLNTITALAAYFVLIVCCFVVPTFYPYRGLLIIFGFNVLFSPLAMEWFYTMREDFVYITVRTIAMQVIAILLTLIFVKSENDYYIYACISVFSTVGTSFFNFFHARKYITYKFIINKRIFSHLKSSIVFFSNSLAISIYANIDTTMLGLICGDYYVGIYSVAVKVYSIIKTLINAIISTITPRLTYYRMNNMESEYNNMISELFKMMITLVLPVIVGINIVASEIIFIISGDGYAQSVYSLQVLSIAMFGSLFGGTLVGSVLISSRMEKKALFISTISAIINLVLNIFMIPVWKEIGAAITTVIAEFTVFALGCVYSKGKLKLTSLKNVIVSSVVSCIVMVIASFVLDYWVNNIVLSLIIKVLCCSVLCFITSILLKNEFIWKYLNYYRLKLF